MGPFVQQDLPKAMHGSVWTQIWHLIFITGYWMTQGFVTETQSFPLSLRLPALISPLSTVTRSQHHMTAVQRHPNERVMLDVLVDITWGTSTLPGSSVLAAIGSERVWRHKGTGTAWLLLEEGCTYWGVLRTGLPISMHNPIALLTTTPPPQ